MRNKLQLIVTNKKSPHIISIRAQQSIKLSRPFLPWKHKYNQLFDFRQFAPPNTLPNLNRTTLRPRPTRYPTA